MLSRRAWKSVVFDVEVSSRKRCCPGSHASQSYFLAAEEPSSSDRDVHDAVRDPSAVRISSSCASSRSCSSRASSGVDEAEHLDLVELVHAEDPARVAPRGARLAAEAGREARVAHRQPAAVEDLPRVQRRQRDLARPREVERVVGEPVDLLLRVGQEAGAVERLLAHEHRRDHRLEAVAAQHLQRPAHERQLEQHEVALEVGEAGAGHARARLHVDPRAAQLEVVLRRSRPRLAALVEDLVLVGRGRVGRVGQRGELGVELGLHAVELLAQRLAARGDRLHRGDRLRGVLARLLGRGDRLRRLVLLRLDPLGLGQQLAPPHVERQHPVQPLGRAVAPPRERLAHGRGILPDRLQVEHGRGRLDHARRRAVGSAALSLGVRARRRRGRRLGRVRRPRCPSTSARKSATFSASSPTRMSCGIGPDEKPPLAIA